MRVIKKEKINFNKKVYDLKIKDNHNYFITKKNILVHNSGKTYVLSKVRSGSIEPRIVNTDRLFPLFKDKWSSEWRQIEDRVKLITKDQLLLYINSMLPLAVDGTSSNSNALLRRVGLLKSLGYDADAMIFVTTDLDIALDRASKRERYVPPEFIKSTYEKMKKLKDYYKSNFKLFIEIKTNNDPIDNKVVTKAFNQLSGYYMSDLKNPIGKGIIKEMREKKLKYLMPDIYSKEYLHKILSVWYKH